LIVVVEEVEGVNGRLMCLLILPIRHHGRPARLPILLPLEVKINKFL
jgi:hypothetical protein